MKKFLNNVSVMVLFAMVVVVAALVFAILFNLSAVPVVLGLAAVVAAVLSLRE